jgi:hypothetical protein
MSGDLQDLSLRAAETAVRKCLNADHFSICTIDKVIKLLGRVPDSQAYRILSTVHCVDYKDMDVQLRQSIPGLIARCLHYPKAQIEDMWNGQTVDVQAEPLSARKSLPAPSPEPKPKPEPDQVRVNGSPIDVQKLADPAKEEPKKGPKDTQIIQVYYSGGRRRSRPGVFQQVMDFLLP